MIKKVFLRKKIMFQFFIIFLSAFILCCSKNEKYSGGLATSFDFSLGAFSKIAPNVSLTEKIHKFNRGSSIFKATWQTNLNKPFYGLGPLFNSVSCAGCHTLNGRGRNNFPNEKEFFSMSFKISQAENYGKALQLKSIDEKKIPPEVKISVIYQEVEGEFPDGEKYSLRKPIYKFENWSYGYPKEFQVSARVAPAVFGLGLLSLISEEDLKFREDPFDKNGDGISGKLNLVDNLQTKQKEVGRFGWKATHPNLKQFIANAFLEDIGITTEVFLNQSCTPSQTTCKQAQDKGMEIDINSFSDLEFYIHYLAVPARRNLNDPNVQEGKNLFQSVGCENCHIAEWKTKNDPNFPDLSHQIIFPYTDLMLHEMGEGLSDGLEEFLANGSEWRTPALWGIGLYSLVNQHNFLLHDGRARGLQEAILWHDGEAKLSKERYMNLRKEDREKILKFLESL